MRSSSEDERVAFLDSHYASSRLSASSSSDYEGQPLIVVDSFDSHDGYHDKSQYLSALGFRQRARRLFWWIRWHRRPARQLASYFWKYTLALAAVLLVFTPLLAPSYQTPPAHYRELEARCYDRGWASRHPDALGCANPFNETVFISISLFDEGGRLATGNWGAALLDVIDLIGPDHVFLSIYENDSGEHGAAALKELKRQVPCRHEIIYEDHVPLNIMPNITLPDGTVRTKRLAYLSEIRNRALRPLDTFGGVDRTLFDKILFLNDVAFEPMDALHLLFSTNVGTSGRAEYLSVCSMDWKIPFIFYDIFAQRDAEGYSNGLPVFPIFSGAGKGQSRADMMAEKDAVRVKGCWGGMVAMQASYVQNTAATLPRPDFQDIAAHVIDPNHPTSIKAPVRFRYEPEIYADACECCLFLADVSQAARIAGAPEEATGVYVNPYVRVTYDWSTRGWARLIQRWERLFVVPQFFLTPLFSLPSNNPHRMVQEGESFVEEVWNSTSNSWGLVQRIGRSGMFCNVRETQVMRLNGRWRDRNWEHIKIPEGRTLDFTAVQF